MKIAVLSYIKHDGKTLMIHRNKREKDLFKDIWNGVGGKLKDDESPEDALRREVKEETGLTIKEFSLNGVLTFCNNRFSGETWYVFVYTITKFEGELQENDEGELHWIEDNEIRNLNIQDADSVFMDWLDNNKFFSAKFTFSEENPMEHDVFFY